MEMSSAVHGVPSLGSHDSGLGEVGFYGGGGGGMGNAGVVD